MRVLDVNAETLSSHCGAFNIYCLEVSAQAKPTQAWCAMTENPADAGVGNAPRFELNSKSKLSDKASHPRGAALSQRSL